MYRLILCLIIIILATFNPINNEFFSTAASPGLFTQLAASSPDGDKVRTSRFTDTYQY